MLCPDGRPRARGGTRLICGGGGPKSGLTGKTPPREQRSGGLLQLAWSTEPPVFCQDTQSFTLHITDDATGFEDAVDDGFNVAVGSEPECMVDGDCPAGYTCTCAVCEVDTLIELGNLGAGWVDDGVAINWVSDMEIDHAYYNLYRAEHVKAVSEKAMRKSPEKLAKKLQIGFRKR